jgi:hypothetical protein
MPDTLAAPIAIKADEEGVKTIDGLVTPDV